MKFFSASVAAVALAIFFSCSPVNGQGKRTELTAGAIEISIELPPGLDPFPAEKMAQLREKGVLVKFVFSDPQADLIVTVNTFGSEARENKLSEVAENIKNAAQTHGDHFELVRNDRIQINGRKWLRLSFKEGAGENERVENYFLTDWLGQYVELDFSITAPGYEKHKTAIERSARTILLSLIAEAPG